MRKIAFIGSRSWTDPDSIGLQINECFIEHGAFMLVSGGVAGACKIAEETAREFGIPIISFRPVQIDPFRYGVDECRFYRGKVEVVRWEITWADYGSAAAYRSLLIAERADEGYAYWDGYSRGTDWEIEAFQAAEKQLVVKNLRIERGAPK